MFSSCNRRLASIRILLICATVISCVGGAMSQSQSNAADLQGTVRDPHGRQGRNSNRAQSRDERLARRDHQRRRRLSDAWTTAGQL